MVLTSADGQGGLTEPAEDGGKSSSELAARVSGALRESLSFLGDAALAAQRAGRPTLLERFLEDSRRTIARVLGSDDSMVAIRSDALLRGFYKTQIQAIGSGGCVMILGAAFFALWLVWLAMTLPWLLAVMCAHVAAVIVIGLVRSAVRREKIARVEAGIIGKSNASALASADELSAALDRGSAGGMLAARGSEGFRLVQAEFTTRLTDTTNNRRTFAGAALVACANGGCETLFAFVAPVSARNPAESLASAMASSPVGEKMRAVAASAGVPLERMEFGFAWSPGDGASWPREPDVPTAMIRPGEKVMARTGPASWVGGTVVGADGEGHAAAYLVETAASGRVWLPRKQVTAQDDGHGPDSDPSGRYEILWSDEWWYGGFVRERFGRACKVAFDEGTTAWVDSSRLRRIGSKSGHFARKYFSLSTRVAAAILLVSTAGYTFLLPDIRKAAMEREARDAIKLSAPAPGPLLRAAPDHGRTVFARFEGTEACYLAKVTGSRPGAVEVEFVDDRSVKWIGLDDWALFGDCVGPGTRGVTPFGGAMRQAVVIRRDGLDIRFAVEGRVVRDGAMAGFVIPYRDLLVPAPRRPLARLSTAPSAGDIVLSRRWTTRYCVAAIVLLVTGHEFVVKYADGAEEPRGIADLYEDTLLPGCAVEAFSESKSGRDWTPGVIAARDIEKIIVYLDSGGSVEGNYSAVRVLLEDG